MVGTLKQDQKTPLGTPYNISAEDTFFEMKEYELFLKNMKVNSYIKEAPGVICDTDAAYVRTFNVKSGTTGKIIQVRCPESHAISVFRAYQTVFLRCFDKSNREPDPTTRMNFRKVSRYGGISRNCRATYGDLYPYSFPKGVYLSSEELLEMEILNPDTDIERIELSMEADIFETLRQTC